VGLASDALVLLVGQLLQRLLLARRQVRRREGEKERRRLIRRDIGKKEEREGGRGVQPWNRTRSPPFWREEER